MHGLDDEHSGGDPDSHWPATHVLWPLQAFMSESHAVPSVTGVSTHPLDGSHAAVMHGLSVVHADGVPGTQAPAPSQVGAPWQRSAASPQGVPAGADT